MWTLEPRGDLRADLRTALLAKQLLTMMSALASSKSELKDIPLESLVLDLEPIEDEPEDGEPDDPEVIEQDVELAREWVARSKGGYRKLVRA